ncbi:hypothetical protein Tco_1488507 [Tanacetum coccineum]
MLDRAEGEATEVIRICCQNFELETTTAAWAKELADLGARNAKLSGQVFGVESLRDELKDQVLKLENDRRDLRSEIKGESKIRDEFMSIQDAEEVEIEHGKAGRSLAELDAYDSGVAAEYVVAVTELENVSFLLLDQFIVLVYYEHGGSRGPDFISHEIMLSDALAASHARAEKRKKDASSSSDVGGPFVVALDYHISDVSITKDVATSHELQNQIPTEETVHDDMFDTTLLDRPEDHHLSGLGSS